MHLDVWSFSLYCSLLYRSYSCFLLLRSLHVRKYFVLLEMHQIILAGCVHFFSYNIGPAGQVLPPSSSCIVHQENNNFVFHKFFWRLIGEWKENSFFVCCYINGYLFMLVLLRASTYSYLLLKFQWDVTVTNKWNLCMTYVSFCAQKYLHSYPIKNLSCSPAVVCYV